MQTSTAMMRSLAIITIITLSIWTVTDAEKISPCCVAASRSEVVEPIIDFKLQLKNLPCIRAVILVTAKAQYCIDPKQPWVRKKIEDFRKKKTMSPTTVSPRPTFSMPQNSTQNSTR